MNCRIVVLVSALGTQCLGLLQKGHGGAVDFGNLTKDDPIYKGPPALPKSCKPGALKVKGLREMCGSKKSGHIPYIGASSDGNALQHIDGYSTLHAHQFNIMTMDAGECQWGNYYIDPHDCEWGLHYAEKNNIAFRFHALLWVLRGYPAYWKVPDDVVKVPNKGGGTRANNLNEEGVEVGALLDGPFKAGIYPESLWSSHVAGNLTLKDKKKVLIEHVAAMTSRYKGRIHSYDVVNEAVCDPGFFNYGEKLKNAVKDAKQAGADHGKAGTWYKFPMHQRQKLCFFSEYYGVWLRRSLWADGHPETDLVDFIDIAFTVARKHDPHAFLCYNDFRYESNFGPFKEKSDMVLTLLKGLKKRGVPVNCAGLQTHIDLSYAEREGWLDGYYHNMKRLSDMGLTIQITEFDVKCSDMHNDEPCSWNKQKEKVQSELYAGVLKACKHNPKCISFETFGWNDALSFANTESTLRHPYMFNDCGQPKDAYYSMMKVLKQ